MTSIAEPKRVRDRLKALPASERLSKLIEFEAAGFKDESGINFFYTLVFELAASKDTAAFDRAKTTLKNPFLASHLVNQMDECTPEMLKHVLKDFSLRLTDSHFAQAVQHSNDLVFQACVDAKVLVSRECFLSHWTNGNDFRVKEYASSSNLDFKHESNEVWRRVTVYTTKDAIRAALELGLRPLNQDDIERAGALRAELRAGHVAALKRALELVPEMDPEKKLVFP